ncbi:MAG: preprotein translocase subunit YajC [Anaerolineae bacterium]|nr:preprotein translocase subunit YajC [Anaerolineae bacterium]MDQ7034411.1 preprotein translocase subunit YajC [Anaerolineae bacterium]
MAEFIVVVFVLILGMGAYWIFMLMPKQRDFVQRQQLARTLKAGDEVITGGGLVGIVRHIDAESGIAKIEIADGLQVRVLTAAILDVYNPDEIVRNINIGRTEAQETE